MRTISAMMVDKVDNLREMFDILNFFYKFIESEDERKTVDLKDKVSHNLKTLYAQIMKNNGEYKNRWDFLYDMVIFFVFLEF